MIRPMMLGVAVAIASTVAGADTRIEIESKTGGFAFMERQVAAREVSSVVWFGSDRMRTDEGSSSTIVRLDQQAMYLLDHGLGTYSRIALPIDLRTLLPGEAADQMLRAMAFEVDVRPTDDTKDIGDWPCRGWDVTMKGSMMEVTGRYWATSAVDVDASTYLELSGHVLSLQPGYDRLAAALRTIDGVVVAQETRAAMTMLEGQVVESSVRTTSIATGEAPEGHYEPPRDYVEAPFDYMEWMRDSQQ